MRMYGYRVGTAHRGGRGYGLMALSEVDTQMQRAHRARNRWGCSRPRKRKRTLKALSCNDIPLACSPSHHCRFMFGSLQSALPEHIPARPPAQTIQDAPSIPVRQPCVRRWPPHRGVTVYNPSHPAVLAAPLRMSPSQATANRHHTSTGSLSVNSSQASSRTRCASCESCAPRNGGSSGC